MKKRTKVYWTLQAQDDLREIRKFIARDAPCTAAAFIQRVRSAVNRLRKFPESGQVVPELRNPHIREIIFGHYRIIYRVQQDSVEILTVYHAARLLEETEF